MSEYKDIQEKNVAEALAKWDQEEETFKDAGPGTGKGIVMMKFEEEDDGLRVDGVIVASQKMMYSAILTIMEQVGKTQQITFEEVVNELIDINRKRKAS